MPTTKATLKPGQNGTKRLTEKYGERLVCVRYKYDEGTRKRYTTVELIEEESAWVTESPIQPRMQSHPFSQYLAVRVEYWETELQEKVKAAGGIWRPRQKLWEMRCEDVVALGLESRVVADERPPSET
jgi:hypothetical protein